MVDAAISWSRMPTSNWSIFRDTNGREPDNQERIESIILAARSVGRPLFFSLLVITVSFLPVFALDRAGRAIVHPLAFTKTFAMFFASIISITLAPVLMVLLIRGKITPEAKNPVNRLLILALFKPFVHFVLRFRWPIVIAAMLAVLLAACSDRNVWLGQSDSVFTSSEANSCRH